MGFVSPCVLRLCKIHGSVAGSSVSFFRLVKGIRTPCVRVLSASSVFLFASLPGLFPKAPPPSCTLINGFLHEALPLAELVCDHVFLFVACLWMSCQVMWSLVFNVSAEPPLPILSSPCRLTFFFLYPLHVYTLPCPLLLTGPSFFLPMLSIWVTSPPSFIHISP